MLLQNTDWQSRLYTARRVFRLIPVFVFLLSLALFAEPVGNSPYQFGQLLLHVALASLASSVVCVAAYNFYRYLIERSPGL